MKAADPKNPTLQELLAGLKVRHESDEHGYFSSFSGGPCYLRRPDLSSIYMPDILAVLPRIARWGGRSRSFYSVAQHSVIVSKLCSPENAMVGLLHDAVEAYLGDVASPLKRCLPEYKRLERLWALEIGKRAGLGDKLADLPDDVLRADLLALEVERHDLLAKGAGWHWWGLEDRPTDLSRLVPLAEDDAYLLLVGRFVELGGSL